MKNKYIVLLLVLMAASVIVGVKLNHSTKTASYAFSYDAQLAQAKQDHKPVWLLMHSTTCDSCLEMTKIFKQLQPQFEADIAFIQVDVNDRKAKDLTNRYGINLVPTTILLDQKGKQVLRQEGLIGVVDMQKQLEALKP